MGGWALASRRCWLRSPSARSIAYLPKLPISPSAHRPIRPSTRSSSRTATCATHPDAAPGWVAHLANRLHVRTRQGVIRRRLLLNRGDAFDRARMEESERSLRTLGVFRSVRVDTVRAEPGGKLALRAVTSDGWSTQP